MMVEYEVIEMYSEAYFEEHKAQLKKRTILLGLPALILTAGIVVSFIVRIEPLTVALTIVLGAFCIFTYDLLLHPVKAYVSYLDGCLHGRTHILEGMIFKEITDEKCRRDGVTYYPVTVSANDPKDEMDDRLLYYDANLSVPDWKNGEKITFTVHDKSICAWQRADT